MHKNIIADENKKNKKKKLEEYKKKLEVMYNYMCWFAYQRDITTLI